VTQHLLAYYRWDRRTHWKLDNMDRREAGKPVLAYVSHDPGLFPKYALPGNVLWVIGLGPDRCPTLEACIRSRPGHRFCGWAPSWRFRRRRRWRPSFARA
jgi:hypothetical protein